jgi:glycosyltransferase involved in cell wall biosynthesis
MKIIHVITGLDLGGAETMLFRLLKHIDRTHFDNQVISLIPAGVVGDQIRTLDIPVNSLGMRSGHFSLRAILQLINIIRRERPDVVQTWMYHSDLMGGMAGYLTRTPVVWGIHNTALAPGLVKTNTIWVVNLNSRLSRWLPRQIITCSEAASKVHQDIGYFSRKIIVIPNGFDLGVFKPDPAARISLRHEFSLPPDTHLIGLVARFDPLKDHHNFILAAGQFHQHHPQAHFILCGERVSETNSTLTAWIESNGIRENCHLLGRRNDIPRVMAGLDVNTLSSIGEAFPNVLGEAMASGIPCVSTDVGDAAEIIGDTGVLVPVSNPQALADGWGKILLMKPEERTNLGERARSRVQQNYDIVQVTRRYQDVYSRIAN